MCTAFALPAWYSLSLSLSLYNVILEAHEGSLISCGRESSERKRYLGYLPNSGIVLGFKDRTGRADYVHMDGHRFGE